MACTCIQYVNGGGGGGGLSYEAEIHYSRLGGCNSECVLYALIDMPNGHPFSSTYVFVLDSIA